MKLIIPLTDNWNYYHGGKHDWVDWLGYTGNAATSCILPDAADITKAGSCAFYSEQNVIDAFKNYVKQLLTHKNSVTGVAFKDDPTILCWETGNELVGVSTSWTKTISDYIKEDLGA